MPPALTALPGDRFGRLTAVRRVENRRGLQFWQFRCDCGETVERPLHSAKSGVTKSCGCHVREITSEAKRGAGHHNFKHGQGAIGRQTREYRAWGSMLSRCNNPDDLAYARYGARGIKVCDRWRDFENFFADMGLCPPGLSIERNDNDGNYEPSNCRWASRVEQGNNRRSNRMVTFRGVEMTLADAVRLAGLSYAMVRFRLKRGWPIERALSEPTFQPKLRRPRDAE